jgi:hypothetical protein
MGECYGGVRGVQGQAWMRGGLGVIGYVISMHGSDTYLTHSPWCSWVSKLVDGLISNTLFKLVVMRKY